MSTACSSALRSAAVAVYREATWAQKARAEAKRRAQIKRAQAAFADLFRRQGRLMLERLPRLAKFFLEEAAYDGDLVDAFADVFGKTRRQAEKALVDSLFDGINLGYTTQATQFGIEQSFKIGSKRAMDWARTNAASRVTMIDETTRESIQGVITRGIESGESYGAVARDIRDRFEGFSTQRAETVAVTECLIHSSAISGPVSSIYGATRRWYFGDIIEITTSGGYKLAGTPNHPILTDTGWVALDALIEGDNVVCCGGGQKVGSGDPYIEDIPPTISQVFEALRDSPMSVVQRVAGTNMDFHGDGREGEVEIVSSFGSLELEEKTVLSEPALHDLLSVTDELGGMLVGTCASGQGVLGSSMGLDHSSELSHSSSCSGVGISEEGSALIGRSSSPLQADILTRRSHPNPMSLEDRNDYVNGSPERGSNGGTRFSGLISLDNITMVKRTPFVGHVYNLRTSKGWFVANGIVTHNCAYAYEEGNASLVRDIEEVGIKMEKSWSTIGGDACEEICGPNEAEGWIAADDAFQSGDMQPPGHPNCRCTTLYRVAEG